ncbi:MAG: peptidoglycan DD-metalloendopeptidase family protein [Legionellaceae bacterium]|nr:peptidoglycan DD-metalloendopeptidase family protein [Legionellaceae bacterium]
MLINVTYGENNAIVKTKASLNQLEAKIRLLQQHLDHVQDKQTLLKQELVKTDKKINEGLRQFKKIQQDYSAKEAEINLLQPQIDTLNATIHTMQLTLIKYLRARYKSSNTQQLSWLFNQNNPQTMDRLFTYYQYLVRSNKRLMDNLKATQKTLALKKEKLDVDRHELQTIQELWRINQQKLSDDKNYHTTLIHSLSQDIQNKQHTLATYKRNQINLSRLLTSLAQQSVLQTRHPLTQMKKRLIQPVNTDRSTIQKINQGILFKAPEGTSVHAVSPGKVVFCDWLNGYGLLLIIDHGWGFMTLYANNLALFKQKGDTVSQGEQIATVGHSGALRQNGLYFEIRHRGKAIPPLEWLR